MKRQELESLKIDQGSKEREQKPALLIFVVVAVITGVVLYFAWPRASDSQRVVNTNSKKEAAAASSTSGSSKGADGTSPAASSASVSSALHARANGSVLTVSGYIVNRERIELSPRFMGVVKWIGVKKGDYVTNSQVVVLLDDAEYQARKRETEGRLASANANLQKAKLNSDRVAKLMKEKVESEQLADDWRLNVASATASVQEIEGQLDLIKTYLDWTIIRSPINGVILEKLVDPNELVTPQSFGGTRGPSTALIALADPKDLQVEIDVSEADVAKVYLQQKCKVSPEAYPDKVYDGYVAEKAPEASRQKGTLQIKVQILNPDLFLTPELSAKVDFIGKE